MSGTGIPTEPILNDHIARGSFLELYIPLADDMYRYIEENCSETSEAYFELWVLGIRNPQGGGEVDNYIKCITRDLIFHLDGENMVLPDFVFSTYDQSEVTMMLGLLPVDSLSRGKHLLEIALYQENDTTRLAYLPFLKP